MFIVVEIEDDHFAILTDVPTSLDYHIITFLPTFIISEYSVATFI